MKDEKTSLIEELLNEKFEKFEGRDSSNPYSSKLSGDYTPCEMGCYITCKSGVCVVS